jgi:hypothetical protein
MSAVPMKKGLSFLAARDYVKKRSGAEGWDAVLADLAPSDADTLRSMVGIGWYPLDLYARLLRVIDQRLGTGDRRIVPHVCHFEAERDVPSVHRLLLKMVKPATIVEKMAELWPRYNSTGRLIVSRRGDRAVDVTLVDWSPDDLLCAAVVAYSERALELAGARGVRIAQPRCRARGAHNCLFEIKWGALDR